MTDFQKITEADSLYRHLEKMKVKEILESINKEDRKVPQIVQAAIPQIEALVMVIADKMLAGGRLFYIGAGTSGRLGIVDASECTPTFGVEPGLVIAIIAGGDKAITHAVEFAEDNTGQGWQDLLLHQVNSKDVVLGLSAGGTTPYVIAALQKCQQNNISTASICCNSNAPVGKVSDYPIEVVTGPEFITGSTRMKSGTAQKLILNMISTSIMIILGRVADNKMVNMQLTNEKLIDRGVKILMDTLKIDHYETAKNLLIQHGSVSKAIESYRP